MLNGKSFYFYDFGDKPKHVILIRKRISDYEEFKHISICSNVEECYCGRSVFTLSDYFEKYIKGVTTASLVKYAKESPFLWFVLSSESYRHNYPTLNADNCCSFDNLMDGLLSAFLSQDHLYESEFLKSLSGNVDFVQNDIYVPEYKREFFDVSRLEDGFIRSLSYSNFVSNFDWMNIIMSKNMGSRFFQNIEHFLSDFSVAFDNLCIFLSGFEGALEHAYFGSLRLSKFGVVTPALFLHYYSICADICLDLFFNGTCVDDIEDFRVPNYVIKFFSTSVGGSGFERCTNDVVGEIMDKENRDDDVQIDLVSLKISSVRSAEFRDLIPGKQFYFDALVDDVAHYKLKGEYDCNPDTCVCGKCLYLTTFNVGPEPHSLINISMSHFVDDSNNHISFESHEGIFGVYCELDDQGLDRIPEGFCVEKTPTSSMMVLKDTHCHFNISEFISKVQNNDYGGLKFYVYTHLNCPRDSVSSYFLLSSSESPPHIPLSYGISLILSRYLQGSKIYNLRCGSVHMGSRRLHEYFDPDEEVPLFWNLLDPGDPDCESVELMGFFHLTKDGKTTAMRYTIFVTTTFLRLCGAVFKKYDWGRGPHWSFLGSSEILEVDLKKFVPEDFLNMFTWQCHVIDDVRGGLEPRYDFLFRILGELMVPNSFRHYFQVFDKDFGIRFPNGSNPVYSQRRDMDRYVPTITDKHLIGQKPCEIGYFSKGVNYRSDFQNWRRGGESVT